MLKPNIQLFADGGEGGQGNADPGKNGGVNAQEGGNTPKTYTQEELDRIVSERTGRATKSALKSFFSQKGLSEEEANQAMNEYLETKRKNTPDVGALQNTVASERSARIKAQLRADAQLEAIKQGVDVEKSTRRRPRVQGGGEQRQLRAGRRRRRGKSQAGFRKQEKRSVQEMEPVQSLTERRKKYA